MPLFGSDNGSPCFEPEFEQDLLQPEQQHYIGLITGLGSSLPGLGLVWTKWARSLQKRLAIHYFGRAEVKIMRVSSDGTSEKKFFDAVLNDHHTGRLGKVVGAGHSNGCRDWLFGAKSMYPKIGVNYLGLIDMTLGEFGAEAYGNINHLDEFHAILERVDFHPSFFESSSSHDYFKINKGHTAAANDKSVQDRIFNQIISRI